jgi:hypothetical protein
MKMKKEYMILLGIIAVLLIYLLFGTGRSKMSYDVPKLKNLVQEDITRIEISLADRSVTLAGGGEDWMIQPQGFPADPVKVKDMLDTIAGLQLTELAAEKQDYQRYDLDDDSGITVKAYRDQELLREFAIGKTPSTYRHTFVRMADDIRVYYARESFRSRFEFDVKDLRDKRVMSFDKNEISEIRITQANETLVFDKKAVPAPKEAAETEADTETEPSQEPPAEQEAWVTADGRTGDKPGLDTILSELSDLSCDEFLDDGASPDQDQEPVFSVTVKGTRDYTLRIFTKQDTEDGKYPALSSENSHPFLLSTYKAERIIKKEKDLFLEEKEEEIK